MRAREAEAPQRRGGEFAGPRAPQPAPRSGFSSPGLPGLPPPRLPAPTPGPNARPPFRPQNGGDGTRRPAPRKPSCPSEWGTRGPAARPVTQTRRARRAQGAWAAASGPAPPRPPRRALPTAPRTLRTPRAGLRRRPRPRQPHTAARTLGSRCKPLPSRGSPNARGGTGCRTRPSHSSRLRAEGAFGEAWPIPALGPENWPMEARCSEKSPPLVTYGPMGGRIFLGL